MKSNNHVEAARVAACVSADDEAWADAIVLSAHQRDGNHSRGGMPGHAAFSPVVTIGAGALHSDSVL